MMDFGTFKLAIQRQFNKMKKHELFRVDLDKNQLWETYLSSFPEGSNPLYKERTEHDCQCCKSFIRSIGNMVAIIDGEVVSLWDVEVPDEAYQTVSNALSALVKSTPIDNLFLHTEAVVGTDKTFLSSDTISLVKSWSHFFIELPRDFTSSGVDIGSRLGDYRTTKEVMLRGLTEITHDALDTVLELINQNSLYRGDEHKFAVTEFKKLKVAFDKAPNKEIFCWSKVKTCQPSVSRIRGTVIGTLLCDISEGNELDDCVKSFESKVAPTNYKRPTAIVTKGMIEKAKKTLEELGFLSSLDRRYAVLEDISINNILFADRSAKPRINDVFDKLLADTPKIAKNLDRVEEISIDDFVTKILPQITGLEIMVENNHSNNFVSLVAPVDMTAKTMFKWSNGFSWSYAGDVADSIKERVKQAGGKVDGDLRCSLSWFNHDDLDLHMCEPGGNEIYYSRKYSERTQGKLDVDMNAGCGTSRSAVENITYPDRKKMLPGVYRLVVHNFSKRESIDVGFEVEIEFDGSVFTFAYDKAVQDGGKIVVADIEYKKDGSFTIVNSLPSSKSVRTNWEIPSQSFKKVNVMMLSPNHWDGHGVGNKHYFFMLEGCKNDGTVRGFYNEFLHADLDKHRKVLEVVGSRVRTEEADDQLSGLGFSSTLHSSILCRVTGNFSRTLKINL